MGKQCEELVNVIIEIFLIYFFCHTRILSIIYAYFTYF